ncbi:MAG: biotin/lipoyl-binding protein, partial [Boseongicola sp.]|nr:biotin/lipoyl-binding protein [Boseongicola sp.]
MATEILMPALSPTMEEGTLAKWLVKEGDTVSSGDILAEIETDKATMEFEAVDEGTVGKILVAEGSEGVKVNTPIAVLIEEGESADDIATPAAPIAAPEAAPAVEEAASVAAAPIQASVDRSPDYPEGTEMVSTTVREALR